MGTTYSITLVADLTAATRAQIEQQISLELAAINRRMSTFDPDSELSRFNRFDSTAAFPVSPDTVDVFEIARAVSDVTGGAFDVTVGPVVALWGFGATDRIPAPPPAEDLARLLPHVGYRLVHADKRTGSLSKTDPLAECDLSAIAKGYAVDKLARVLLDRGYENFLVEIGGDLLVHGRREDGERWHVAIERPEPKGRAIYRVVELENQAMATSGDYRNYYVKNGRRLSHLIDPRTGHPIEHGLASVSVVDASAARADALATALAVLGPTDGYSVAESQGLAAFFIRRVADGKLQTSVTPAFPALRTVTNREAGSPEKGS